MQDQLGGTKSMKIDHDKLCMLAYLGLWESAEFYGAEQYKNMSEFIPENGFIWFSCMLKHGRSLIRLDLFGVKKWDGEL